MQPFIGRYMLQRCDRYSYLCNLCQKVFSEVKLQLLYQSCSCGPVVSAYISLVNV